MSTESKPVIDPGTLNAQRGFNVLRHLMGVIDPADSSGVRVKTRTDTSITVERLVGTTWAPVDTDTTATMYAASDGRFVTSTANSRGAFAVDSGMKYDAISPLMMRLPSGRIVSIDHVAPPAPPSAAGSASAKK